MKNKKIVVNIIIIIIVVLIAIILGVYTVYTSHLFNSDGTIHNPEQELITHLKSIEDDQSRREAIDHTVNENILTQEQANELY